MLTGRTAVITGSTSGIGRGIALKLAAEGAQIMINGFGDKADIDALIAELEKLSGKRAFYSDADMTDPDQIAEMIKMADAKMGGVDILMNNAGIQHVSPVEDFPADKWEQIIAINLSSAFYTTKAVITGMKSRGWGRIINLASAHSLVASPYKSAYVAAKHGIAGLTKTVALEAAEFGVTVNAVSPGYVLTPLVQAQIDAVAKDRGISEDEAKLEGFLAKHPNKDFIEVDDVAATVVYLCSDAAKGITGTNISMDGGWTAV
ncbi:3-hydroxybutyrate dehydrogenase [Amylibacter sp. SFDW26]|uniref:3-hydroxybutyrate dehydrogenase n=1 Tax=Amylibacter sp. SFDW26 TaxID=2652722 RepID=UPI00126244E9|nr:3-hydroxybutyrate dehydrogenase [Amylibacter sp. SFDW26]KAB7610260.1 3-hydroxybutyrate dehydrogenase [Amylibacter sp. SFDW26]